MPTKFPEAYQKGVQEVERRLDFDNVFYHIASKLKLLLEEERLKRSEFLMKYGQFIPLEALP